ncbi:MAG TPA: acetoin utilization protein AcuC [Candidatus Bathyarchaeia archaeon]|nr:acetoin utilization protein AcuC [Candidatus Bathyarchaeia archaeon]
MAGKSMLVWDDGFLNYDLGPSHPLRPIRVKLTYDLLRTTGALESDAIQVVPPRLANREEIKLFHDEEYVRLVETYSRKGSGLLDMGDTPAFRGCYEASSLIVGASLAACENVMTNKASHAFNPAGGLHHAHPERASGFCIFNDPAIVIAHLRSKFHVSRLLYLDIDAHHGDGVMYGYYDEPAVLDIDFHESGRFLFPGTGFTDEIGEGEARGLKVNVPLPPLTGDEAYLAAFKQIVPSLVRKYKPEVILVQCGADGHADDRLAHLRMTTSAYQKILEEMHRLAHELCEGRLLLYGGGGYTLGNVPRVWTIAFATLAGLKLSDNLPSKWKEAYVAASGETPPTSLYDKTTTDNEETKIQVNQTLDELRGHLTI